MNLSDAKNIYVGDKPAKAVYVGSKQVWPPIPALTLYGSQSFEYTGSPQEFIVPEGVSEIRVTLNGASGGTNGAGNAQGGLGARVVSKIDVTPGETLGVYVGGVGAPGALGGWNGGGNSRTDTTAARRGGSGGGATDIRRGTELTDRLVAAGGGGGGGYGSGVGGGSGGENGSDGVAGLVDKEGHGGTQLAGGAGGTNIYNGGDGSLGQGGATDFGGSNSTYRGGSGGGGYYGGGGGASNNTNQNQGGGGGGSSMSTGTDTTIIDGTSSGNGHTFIEWGTQPELQSSLFAGSWPDSHDDLWPSDWVVTSHLSAGASQTGSGTGRLTVSGTLDSTVYAAPTGITNSDVEVLTRVEVLGNEAQRSRTQTRILLRWDGTMTHTPVPAQPTDGYLAVIRHQTDAQDLRIFRLDSGASAQLGSTISFPNEGSFWVRARSVGSSIQVKVWRSIDSEPLLWSLSATDSTYTSGLTGIAFRRTWTPETPVLVVHEYTVSDLS